MEFKILNTEFEYRVDANNILKSVLQNEKGQPIFRSNLTWKIKDQVIKDQINGVTEVEDVRPLPKIGQPVTEGVLYYGYSTGGLESERGLIKCVKSHNRTIYNTKALIAFFYFRNKSTGKTDSLGKAE